MNELTPPLAGHHRIEPGWWFGIRRRAEWRDTDGFGHVNHLAYLAWCEEARNRYLEAIGLPRLSATVPGPVVKAVSFAYEAPLGYGDEVVVTARTASFRRTSFCMAYAVWHCGLVGRGTALCVLMVNASGERVPIPDSVRVEMVTRDGAIVGKRREPAAQP